MMVEATPPAPFVLAEPGLLFELLIIAGNAPPQLGGVDQIAGRDVARKGRERVQRGRVAWLPPSWHHVHRSLRIPDLREGDDSPLRTSFRHAAPATCRTRQLSTPRIPPCGLNGTSQTRSPPCAEGSSQLSSDTYHAAHAAAAQPGNVRVAICNAVVLAQSSVRVIVCESGTTSPAMTNRHEFYTRHANGGPEAAMVPPSPTPLDLRRRRMIRPHRQNRLARPVLRSSVQAI